MIEFKPENIDWSKSDGLVPVVVQDVASLRVLMLGYMNKEALDTTLKSNLVTFYSRTKQRLWQKGETSGHVLHLKSMKLDCDNDTLLAMVEPVGPTCHTGTQTCWGDDDKPSLATLADLAAVIAERKANPVAGSYTTSLFNDGIARIAQKVGEEGVETALAAATKGANLADETADLLYHLFVLLEATGLKIDDVVKILHSRATSSKGKK